MGEEGCLTHSECEDTCPMSSAVGSQPGQGRARPGPESLGISTLLCPVLFKGLRVLLADG